MSRPLLAGFLLCGFLVNAHASAEVIRAAVPAETRAPDYAAIALEHERLARKAGAGAREDHLLDAASAYIQGKGLTSARHILDGLRPSSLSPSQAARRQIMLAKISLALDRNPRAALDQLQSLPPRPAPELRAETHRIRALAYAQLGNALESARERSLLAPLITDKAEREENAAALWSALNTQSEQTLLTRKSTLTPGDAFSGWLELATIIKAPPEDRASLLQTWRARYPGHPATTRAADLATAVPAAGAPANGHLALLLPLTGHYAAAAAALHKGFMAAQQADSRAGRPAVRVYDTGGEPPRATAIYEQAISEGARMVVGPLEKDAVDAIAARGELPVPTLALNYADARPNLPPQLYQFGLSPENEARQAAQRAWADGRSGALVLYPEGEWGLRTYAAFKTRWTELGGVVLEAQSYRADASDYATPVRRLLNLDESEARVRRLKAILGGDVKAEPRRRTDADSVFIIASAAPARAIRPLFNFHYAGDLPVYATSHVRGEPNVKADLDLEGVTFCDSPWVLANKGDAPLARELNRAAPTLPEQLRRLYAMGADAYALIRGLGELAQNPGTVIEGATGRLSLEAGGRVHRGLVCARYVGGTARLVEDAGN